eukprot:4136165-Alexandrium_andersonii.AAC.1
MLTRRRLKRRELQHKFVCRACASACACVLACASLSSCLCRSLSWHTCQPALARATLACTCA